MRFSQALVALAAAFWYGPASAQQYVGDVIPNSLPGVPGSEITYFRVSDPTGRNNNLTLINYVSHQQSGPQSGQRLNPNVLERMVIIIHGQNRDPGTYMSNGLSALSQVTGNPNVNFSTVGILAPYFPNGEDKNYGYPWVDGAAPGQGSTSNCLVWFGSKWSAGAQNQYPYNSRNTSTYTVLDQIIQYYDNATLYPNMKQIVVAGHSLGGQTVQRYAAIGQNLNTRTPVSFWIGNPDSYAWLNQSRPFRTDLCPTYDNYRAGYTNFTDYPMTYGRPLVKAGRQAIIANFQSKAIAWARGTLDLGDDSQGCEAPTQGANRDERFFNFIKYFPPSCADPSGRNCDTVDFVDAGHDAGAMFASPAGRARLFTDNFNGNGSRAYDFGYPRQQAGDDPYPNPALVNTPMPKNTNVYAGNMTYQGCWSDQTPATLVNMTYQSQSNTIELCTSTCAQGGNTIAGMEGGGGCYCGSSLGYLAQTVIDSSCGTACPGNSNEICGGGNRLSLFSNGPPTIQPQPVIPATVSGYNFLSCYTEATSGRALSGTSYGSGTSMTLESCAAYCTGYQYFGTEYASQCYCGNSFGPGANQTTIYDCDMLCSGNGTEFCGSSNILTVYQNTTWVPGTVPSGSTPPSGGSGSSPSSSGVSCPSANATIVTSYGLNFTIECGVDHSGGDLTSLSVSTFQQCIDACAQNSQCVDVSLSGSACYLKSVLGAAVSSSGISGARLISPRSGASSSSGASAATSATATSGSTSAPSATVTTAAAPTCPASNGTVYTSGNGDQFLIECGIDHSGGDLSSLTTSTFQQCIDTCANTSQCVDVSLSGSACYLKSSVGAPVSNGVFGARLIGVNGTAISSSTSASSTVAGTTATSSSSTASATATTAGPACPASNGTVYTSGNGEQFIIECGIDHSGGDLTSLSTSTFQQCIDTCANNPQCVDVSLSGSACYLKSSVGAPVSNGVFGARLIGVNGTAISSSSSSSTVAGTTSTTATSSSSTASATATTAGPACPASNGTLYTSGNGEQFAIECGIDHQAGDLTSLSVSSFQQCIDTCANNPQCVDVSLSGSACYLKSSVGAPVYNSVFGARLVAINGTSLAASGSSSSSAVSSTLSSSTSTIATTSTSSAASSTATVVNCPASNSTIYTAANNQTFLIQCGIDHQAGDLTSLSVNSFQQCIETCSNNTQCVDVSLSGSACYLKSSVGAPVYNAVFGARLVNLTSSSTSLSSSATATTTST